MSVPIDHHYIPIFYLKAWAPNGCLWRYYKHEDGRVIDDEKPPSKVGYDTHLNTLHGTEDPAALENYLTGLDDKAAPVLDALRRGASPSGLSDDDRRSFAKLVASLLERPPDRVRLREDMAAQRLEELKASPKMGPMIDSLPPSLIEKHLDPLIAGRVGLKQIIEDPDWIDRFVGWRWAIMSIIVADVEGASRLITSDEPVVWRKNDEGYVHTITLAISPTQLFIARPQSMALTESDSKILVGLYNVQILTGRAEAIFSSTPLDDDLRKAMGVFLREAHWR